MKDRIDFQKRFFEILKSSDKLRIVNGNIEIPLNIDIKNEISELGIEHEELNSEILIISNKLPFTFFMNKEDFELYNDFEDSMDIFILNNFNPICRLNGIEFYDFEKKNTYYFSNALNYKKFISLLKDQEVENSNGFQFTDSMNLDLGKIVFINNFGNFRLKISYKDDFTGLNIDDDYSIGLIKLTDCFVNSDKNYLRFIKSSLIEYGNSISYNDKLKYIFKNLEQILHKAEMNFEVYLSELSIDKFKKDYDELKTKYFKELSDTLSKISQKIIVLPVGVSASLIAIDRVKNDNIFMILLLLVILATSILLSFLVNSNLRDLSYLYRLFGIEYDQLKSNQFFQKYPLEFNFFKEIRDNVLSKVKFYSGLSKVFYWVMNLSNLFLLIFILSCFDFFTINSLYFIGFVLIILLSICFFNLKKVQYS